MRFEVSKADYEIYVSVLNLLKKGGAKCSITRADIIRESGVSPQLVSNRILNSYQKEKFLKENIA
ncbi:MarR family transcriptional regulator [Sulfurospirillum barnesii]|uniref:Transcriptional regulator n=1 Tax=Sulfurospirillum barnesii (strain ATCC 700032 / DSM 10660 / SES-3) TaxID=760154 RepID=I3Y0P4_SULBS|nr:MarR family transcriptional regulator [Sulfurospirillum barnesii]AFL69768.1 hypothetical protein Sulba_2501 [Sulfurospirillum barnesii SES-3]